MVEAINHIGHVMGKQTIAEFVENSDVLSQLRRIGVDFAQGYGIAKPVPFWLNNNVVPLAKSAALTQF
jgi:EAL domain-containing protein (putative c-di-GMP-specific phosphodiesterase class I)